MKHSKLALLSIVITSLLLSFPVFAANDCVDTTFFGRTCGTDGIFVVLNVALTVLTYGVGILATLGIVISGITYLTVRDNEAQVAKAKARIFHIVIGLALYAVLWTFLQWVIPGGIFGTGS